MSRGLRVTLVSRGYGAAAGARNDEALELERKLPDVPHLQNADRVAAALTAIEEFECQLLLLDDAFQHRRIQRDLDIVLIDALNPFGYGHLLPRGLLREPLSSLARADVIALSRSDLVAAGERARIWEQVRPHAAQADLCRSDPSPRDIWRPGRKVAKTCTRGPPSRSRPSAASAIRRASNARCSSADSTWLVSAHSRTITPTAVQTSTAWPAGRETWRLRASSARTKIS